MSQLVREVWQAFLDLFRYFEDHLSSLDPVTVQFKQVRILYGCGAIDRKRLFELESRIQRGQLLQGEISMIQRAAQVKMEEKGELLPSTSSPAIGRALDRLYEDRALLAEATFTTEQTLKTLSAQIDWIRTQAGLAQQDAQACLPDEATALTFLEIRQQLLDQGAILDKRIKSLQRYLDSFRMLEAQIRMYEVNLKLLQSKEQLAMVRLRINQEFHR